MASYWAIVLTIIDAGIHGDKDKARAYAELLTENLRQAGDTATAERMQHVLDGLSGGQPFGFEPWFNNPDYFKQRAEQEDTK